MAIDSYTLLERVIEKTRAGKLKWEATASTSELVATFGGQYVLRLTSAEDVFDVEYDQVFTSPITLELQSGTGLSVVSIREGDVDPPNSSRLEELWETIRFGGKSAEEVAADAIDRLAEL